MFNVNLTCPHILSGISKDVEKTLSALEKEMIILAKNIIVEKHNFFLTEIILKIIEHTNEERDKVLYNINDLVEKKIFQPYYQ
ncbi:MAG: hypothetical protein ACTSX4_05900 [Candidatus Helarchaeota archaeon]